MATVSDRIGRALGGAGDQIPGRRHQPRPEDDRQRAERGGERGARARRVREGEQPAQGRGHAAHRAGAGDGRAGLEPHDAVGVRDDLGAVGDEQHGPPGAQPLDGAADVLHARRDRDRPSARRGRRAARRPGTRAPGRSAGARPATAAARRRRRASRSRRAARRRRRRRRRARRRRAPRASDAGRPSRMLSATLPRTSAGCWGTQATSARQSSARQPARSTPPTVTRPAVGSRNPSSSAATVLLPAPLSPTSATVSPGASSRSSPSRTRPARAG